MRRLQTIRASSLPLAFLCAGSARAGELEVDHDNEAGRVGTAAHEGLALLAEEGGVPWARLGEIAGRHNVNETEVRVLVAQGAKLWAQVQGSFDGAISEVELIVVTENFVLTGHIDLLKISGAVARAADWKTGRKDSDYSQQMRGYCALALLDNPELTEVTLTLLWVRDEEIENYTMTRAQLTDWVLELIGRVVNWDGVYHPGKHCLYCKRSHECDAANAHLRRDVAILSDRALAERAETELALMAPSDIVELQAKADLVSKLSARVLGAIKQHIESNGDIVADGVRLTLDERSTRQLDTAKTWPILEAHGFSDKEFARVVNLRLSEINSIIAKQAGRGKGAAAVRELSSELEGAGAVSTKTSKILARKRA